MNKTLTIGKWLTSVAVVAVLAGCSSKPETEAVFTILDPNDPNLTVTQDLDFVMQNRNIRTDSIGNINYINGSCPIDVVAHRGSSKYPENSLYAVRAAFRSSFDGAEIDVMTTRDGHWVVYHDMYTGRAAARDDGVRYRISKMKANQWGHLKMRNPDGTLAKYRPPFASEMFQDWGTELFHKKRLNIEIKSEADVTDLYHLDQMAKKYMRPGTYFYSSMSLEVLEHMREVNSSVYLGYIWDPDGVSVQKFKRDARKGINSDEFYRENRKYIERAFKIESRYRSRQKSKKLSAAYVKSKLGKNSGLHVDIRNFVRSPTIYTRAHKLGMRVATYTINGSEYHQEQLVYLQKKGRHLPDEAIMDNTKMHICQKLNPALVHDADGTYKAKSPLVKKFQDLPRDADFERIPEQIDYLKDDMYITVYGDVRSIHARQSSVPQVASSVSASRPKPKPAVFETKDVAFDPSVSPVLISLPSN